MAELINPIENFKQWYQVQDDDIRSQIAFHACACLPERSGSPVSNHDTFDSGLFFKVWLNQNVPSNFQVLGRILCLRALITLVVFRDRGTKEDWEIHIDRMNKMMARMRESGQAHLAEDVAKTLQDIDTRSAIWINA